MSGSRAPREARARVRAAAAGRCGYCLAGRYFQCAEMGFLTLTADGAFAENLIVSGLVEATFALGDRITLGPVVLEVTQIGKECHQGCEIRRITGDCIMPREGLFCRVLVGGQVAVGDAVDLEPGQAPLEAES